MVNNFYADCCGTAGGTVCRTFAQLSRVQAYIQRFVSDPFWSYTNLFLQPVCMHTCSSCFPACTPQVGCKVSGGSCLESLDRSKLKCVEPYPGYVVNDGGIVGYRARCGDQVTMAELVPVSPKPGPTALEMFRLWDVDRSGKVTLSEFMDAAMTSIQVRMKPQHSPTRV